MSSSCAAWTKLWSLSQPSTAFVPLPPPPLPFPLCAWCLKQRSGFCGLIPRSSRCGLVIRCKQFTAVGHRPNTISLVGIQPRGEKWDSRPPRPIWAGQLFELATKHPNKKRQITKQGGLEPEFRYQRRVSGSAALETLETQRPGLDASVWWSLIKFGKVSDVREFPSCCCPLPRWRSSPNNVAAKILSGHLAEKELLLLGESPDSLVYVAALFSPRLFPAAMQRVGRMKSS